ncbi:hypothetical protein BY996DRAFT_424057 [Phakopsora pachyrhizi]|nr:hypothetical protein BY996DRAFT_1494814 [Phakopsora pachyrhizi]KAI8448600.1 hypothetical protein BY996DRAFT_424057 [Phakopsora pachyrhizi]
MLNNLSGNESLEELQQQKAVKESIKYINGEIDVSVCPNAPSPQRLIQIKRQKSCFTPPKQSSSSPFIEDLNFSLNSKIERKKINDKLLKDSNNKQIDFINSFKQNHILFQDLLKINFSNNDKELTENELEDSDEFSLQGTMGFDQTSLLKNHELKISPSKRRKMMSSLGENSNTLKSWFINRNTSSDHESRNIFRTVRFSTLFDQNKLIKIYHKESEVSHFFYLTYFIILFRKNLTWK